MRVSALQLSLVTHEINLATGIEVEEPNLDAGVGAGLEAWLHEISHFVLLLGCLAVENPSEKHDWVGKCISAIVKKRGEAWGVDHELKTLAVEIRVANAIEFPVDYMELALYAIENDNLAPRWKDHSHQRNNFANARRVVRAIADLTETSEVIEAAAYLSRAITRGGDRA